MNTETDVNQLNQLIKDGLTKLEKSIAQYKVVTMKSDHRYTNSRKQQRKICKVKIIVLKTK